jgi:formamidopyrimidine-DNA glycosylase
MPPELPEVETVASGLRRALRGRRIVSVTVHEPRLRRRVAADLPQRLRGRDIVTVSRRGKFLLVHLDADEEIVFHLGMSGTLRVGLGPVQLQRHDHVVIVLDDGGCLSYNDPRRFGIVLLQAAASPGPEGCLGVDPLAPEFTAGALRAISRGRRRPIKNLLMDQALVAGLGNIYANEILSHAGVRPSRAAGRLTGREIDAVVVATRAVLREAIRRRGSSISDFRDARGARGGFQRCFRVYDRAGQPCCQCGVTIRKRVLAGRSSFYCPSCQR